MYCVYRHTCPNNKIYIGITGRKPAERWQNGFGYRNNKHFFAAIKKYGWEKIKHEILFEGMTKEEAEKKEILLITETKSSNPEFGYNVAKGGRSNSGYKHTKETKDKIRNSLKGSIFTDERREKLKNATSKNWKNETFRRHMSDIHKGKKEGKESPYSKTVYQYSLNKELINIFDSVGIAERKTGIDHRQICNCCNMKQQTCHGFIWSYVELQKVTDEEV